MTTSPNRAAGAARKPTLLFVDYAVPQYDLYAGSRTNFMYLELLAELGLDVKFLPADFERVEPYSSELNRMGIETLDGDWYREALTGVERPYPYSLKFLEDQGAWYTPFNRPGMTGRYDIRHWH